MFRKAQAAMEFLMTYGWALLAVLVVIGALAYLGILDVETILPERCTFPVPLNCQDHVINNENIQLVLLNGAGRGMDVRSIMAESEAFEAEGATDANYKCVWTPISSGETAHLGSHLLRNGQSETFTLRWSIPQDTKFALSSLQASLNQGVYTTSNAVGDISLTPDGSTTAVVATEVIAATVSGNQINFEAVLPVTAVTADPTATPPVVGVTGVTGTVDSTQNCFYKDVGRGKNRYAITVYYTWSDSRSILHKVSGELFSASPE